MYNIHIYLFIYLIIYTYIGPSVYPPNLRLVELNSTSIKFEWDELACIDKNGPITGYSYRFYAGSYYLDESELEHESTTHYIVHNIHLEETHSYAFRVSAVNVAGRGPFTPPIVFTPGPCTGNDHDSTDSDSMEYTSDTTTGESSQTPPVLPQQGVLFPAVEGSLEISTPLDTGGITRSSDESSDTLTEVPQGDFPPHPLYECTCLHVQSCMYYIYTCIYLYEGLCVCKFE